jgi:hypothetical protein
MRGQRSINIKENDSKISELFRDCLAVGEGEGVCIVSLFCLFLYVEG